MGNGETVLVSCAQHNVRTCLHSHSRLVRSTCTSTREETNVLAVEALIAVAVAGNDDDDSNKLRVRVHSYMCKLAVASRRPTRNRSINSDFPRYYLRVSPDRATSSRNLVETRLRHFLQDSNFFHSRPPRATRYLDSEYR